MWLEISYIENSVIFIFVPIITVCDTVLLITDFLPSHFFVKIKANAIKYSENVRLHVTVQNVHLSLKAAHLESESSFVSVGFVKLESLVQLCSQYLIAKYKEQVNQFNKLVYLRL